MEQNLNDKPLSNMQIAFFKSLNPSVNKPIVSNLAFLSVKARREHHPTGLFPTSRSDTYE